MDAGEQTVVLIHGMWMTPRSWDNWVDHYADRGYRAIAPGWPGVKDPEETRRDPSALKGLGLAKITDSYDSLIRELERQLLLDRGLGAAGVAIGTAPRKASSCCRLRPSAPAFRDSRTRSTATVSRP